jgi:hypothetical protein
MDALDLGGDIIYLDENDSTEVLVSHFHGLAGRPDYIRKQGEELIPVERKSRHLSPSGADELRGLILYVCGRGAGIPRPDYFRGLNATFCTTRVAATDAKAPTKVAMARTSTTSEPRSPGLWKFALLPITDT